MKKRPVSFCVPKKSNEEILFAVVKAMVLDGTLLNGDRFFEALEKALKEWTSQTQEGKNFLEEKNCHLSLGDLEGFSPSTLLMKILEDYSIKHLYVTVIRSPYHAWTFDSFFCKKTEIGT